MRGKTALLRMYSEIAKTTNVQIIRPTLGVISHELELRSASWHGCDAASVIGL